MVGTVDQRTGVLVVHSNGEHIFRQLLNIAGIGPRVFLGVVLKPKINQSIRTTFYFLHLVCDG